MKVRPHARAVSSLDSILENDDATDAAENHDQHHHHQKQLQQQKKELEELLSSDFALALDTKRSTIVTSLFSLASTTNREYATTPDSSSE